MLFLLRRVHHNLRSAALVLALLGGAALLFWILPEPAEACWISVENQCFDRLPTLPWPFEHPIGTGRTWRRNPQPPYNSWGIQDRYFDTHMCPTDSRSVWCVGTNTGLDPEINNYPAGSAALMIYGPVNLQSAVASTASFWLLNRVGTGDSVCWGASLTANITNTSQMNLAGSHTSVMLGGFENYMMDLAHLHNAAVPDSEVSMLGRPAIYLFWYFFSNTDGSTNKGSFVDNVSISYDNGGLDLYQGGLQVLLVRDSTLLYNPWLGDSVFARFDWGVCNGGTGVYGDFRVTGTFDDSVIFDTLMTGVMPGDVFSFDTNPWYLTEADSHYVRFVIDAQDAITETSESNNRGEFGYFIAPPNPPPVFQWITPADSTEYADTTAIIRYYASDLEEEAGLIFYLGFDGFSCQGIAVPDGAVLEQDRIDSLVWNVSREPNNRVYHPFVRVLDAAHDTCIYAPQLLIIHHGVSSTDRPAGGVPTAYFLAQNYPNPFNPTTELRYGVAVGGQVTLRVYDLLGRMVTELVNGERAPGSYAVEFDGSKLSTGVYLYTLTTPEGIRTEKMMLLK